MIDQRRMADGPLHRLERRFFENCGVQRTPARVLAVSDQPVPGTEHSSVRFARREYGIGWYDHGITFNVEKRPRFRVLLKFLWLPLYIKAPRAYVVENFVLWPTLKSRNQRTLLMLFKS